MKPRVFFKEIPQAEVIGREFFQVVETESDHWEVGDTFSDDDMSMGSSEVFFRDVRFHAPEMLSKRETE